MDSWHEAKTADVATRRDWIAAHRKQYRDARVQEINEALRGRKGGPDAIKPRKAQPGNRSMYEHLNDILGQYAEGPADKNARVIADIARLDAVAAEARLPDAR